MMVSAAPPPDEGDTAAVKKATARKVAGAPTEREKVVARRPRKASVHTAVKKAEAADVEAKTPRRSRPSRAPGA